MSMRWTSRNAETLRKLWGDVAPAEIAERLGTTKNSVIGKADRMGLKRHWTKRMRNIAVADVERMCADGMRVSDIAEAYGVTPNSAYCFMRRNGLKLAS